MYTLLCRGSGTLICDSKAITSIYSRELATSMDSKEWVLLAIKDFSIALGRL